ncbi:hypothetical protein ACFLSJ_02085 [Verrucomicrobiota bacterium]
MIERYMEDLEARIEPEVEDELLCRWRAFLDGQFRDGLFVPERRQKAGPRVEWPHVLVNDAMEDPEKMALQQLKTCSYKLACGNGLPLSVRANYGTAILPSLFGAELFVMDRETDTLPTTWPLPGGEEGIRACIDRGIPDARAGLGGKVLDTTAYYLDLMRSYPRVRRYVHVYHPDVQGPMDVCEMLWGSSLFLALIETPELVKTLLELVTGAYADFMREWMALVPPAGDYAVHWSIMHKGCIMLRDDSAMNLSPSMFEEFIRPFDQRLLTEFGGGAIHFCGRGEHYIPHLGVMEDLHAINLSQPECNDMETIFRHTVDRGLAVIGLQREAGEKALREGRDLHCLVHCM